MKKAAVHLRPSSSSSSRLYGCFHFKAFYVLSTKLAAGDVTESKEGETWFLNSDWI